MNEWGINSEITSKCLIHIDCRSFFFQTLANLFLYILKMKSQRTAMLFCRTRRTWEGNTSAEPGSTEQWVVAHFIEILMSSRLEQSNNSAHYCISRTYRSLSPWNGSLRQTEHGTGTLGVIRAPLTLPESLHHDWKHEENTFLIIVTWKQQVAQMKENIVLQ